MKNLMNATAQACLYLQFNSPLVAALMGKAALAYKRMHESTNDAKFSGNPMLPVSFEHLGEGVQNEHEGSQVQ